MRLTVPRPDRGQPLRLLKPGGSSAVGRLAGLACMVGLALTFAWPALVAGQDEQEDPAAPRGVYSVTISEDDLPPGLAGGPALVGQWTLTLNDDGTYTVARQDVGVIATGSFEVNGATLTFADWTGVLGCGGVEEPAEASYAWEAEGDELRLTPIQEPCADRRILLSTRSFGGFEACATAPLAVLAAPPGPPVPAGTPVGPPVATPSLADEEGVPAGADTQAAIDGLLRQATGCWATGDPARFLALHSQRVLDEIAGMGALAQVASDLRMFMQTPVSFERIGNVELTDPTRASAYVEITFGGEPIPQRFDFALQDGVWLLDTFFLFGPTPSPQP